MVDAVMDRCVALSLSLIGACLHLTWLNLKQSLLVEKFAGLQLIPDTAVRVSSHSCPFYFPSVKMDKIFVPLEQKWPLLRSGLLAFGHTCDWDRIRELTHMHKEGPAHPPYYS